MRTKALLAIAIATISIAAFALITISDGGPALPALPNPAIVPVETGWDGKCAPPPGLCPSVPLRALIEKSPIRWCAGYAAPGGNVALDDQGGWREPLAEIGIEFENACSPYWLVSIWIVQGYLGADRAAQANWSAYHWDKERMWTAGVCTVTINTRATTNPNVAVYWDAMSLYQRRSLVNHEVGHCLGLGDLEGGIMNQSYEVDRPTAANKELLKYRYPYADPGWYRYRLDHP
jgi:hypothetical protein